MQATEDVTAATFEKYRGMTGRTLVAGMPLERDTLRRFVQAIMDTDPLYVDREYAKGTRYGEIAAVIGTTPFLARSSATKPMRRMFVSRSSFENPSPFDRCVRTSSPSSTSTRRRASRSRVATGTDSVDFPAPERPVNQRQNPLSLMLFIKIPWNYRSDKTRRISIMIQRRCLIRFPPR
jgi:hypothetical protein